jgi:hypothetical protein
MAVVFRGGAESVVSVGATFVSAPTTVVATAKDVSYNIEAGKWDSTTKGETFKTSAPTTINVLSASCEVTWAMGDTAFGIIWAAAWANTGLALQILDHTGGSGFWGPFLVDIDTSQPLMEGQTVKVTFTPMRHETCKITKVTGT